MSHNCQNTSYHRRQLAQQVIGLIRTITIQSLEGLGNQPHDPWDEEEGGAGWVDNELSIANDLLEIVEIHYNPPDLSRYITVPQFQRALPRLYSAEHLHFILRFLRHGGSSNEHFFRLRETANERDVEEWFQQNPLPDDS